jgi:hypothetical protein
MADLEQLVLSISADTRQMQKALAKLTGDTQKAAADVDAAFGKASPKIDGVAKSLNKTRFETSNLASQFQDIAVQLQGGASPFTIALQQGTQINQVLGRAGAGGVVSLLGTAFASLLTPVSLATIGIIALGGFAVQYGAKAIGAIGDLDDKLKAHSELIKSLKDAYGEAGKGVDIAVKDSITVLKTLLGLSTADLRKQLDSLARSAVGSMTDIIAVTDSVGGSTVLIEASSKYKIFQSAIDDLRNSVKNGTPDIKSFRIAVSEIEQSTADEKVKKLAGELLSSVKAAETAETAIDGTAKAMRQLGIASLESAEQGEKFAAAMKRLSGTVAPNLTDREKIMKNYEEAMVSAGGTESRLAAARNRDDQLAILSANERKKAGEDAAKSAESAAKRFESMMNSSAKHNAQVLGATPALGQGAGAMASLLEEVRS